MNSDPYLIPGTHVLRNKLNLTDRAQLDRAERLITSERLSEGTPTGEFNLNHLRATHRHLFQDVYDWAGEFRTVDMQKERASSFRPVASNKASHTSTKSASRPSFWSGSPKMISRRRQPKPSAT